MLACLGLTVSRLSATVPRFHGCLPRLSMRGTRHQQKCVHCGLLNSAFPFEHQSPPMCENCIQAKQLTAWSIVPWSRPLCSRHTLVITQRTRSEIGSSLGRFRQLLKLLAELVNVVIILLGIGRGGARSR